MTILTYLGVAIGVFFALSIYVPVVCWLVQEAENIYRKNDKLKKLVGIAIIVSVIVLSLSIIVLPIMLMPAKALVTIALMLVGIFVIAMIVNCANWR